jgi:hypothetical protein
MHEKSIAQLAPIATRNACIFVLPFLYRCPNTGDNVQAWALRAPNRIWSTRRTTTSWALMTIRSYFQFDTRSRLRRFFASSEGWSSLNKR